MISYSARCCVPVLDDAYRLANKILSFGFKEVFWFREETSNKIPCSLTAIQLSIQQGKMESRHYSDFHI